MKVQSTKYTKGTLVLITYDPMPPLFGEVIDIVVNSTVILTLQKHKSLFFDPHYNAFAVRSTSELVAVQQRTLEWHNAFYSQNNFCII